MRISKTLNPQLLNVILNDKTGSGKAASEDTNQKDDTKHKAAALSCKPN